MGRGNAIHIDRQVRRIAISEHTPASDFRGMHMNIARITDTITQFDQDFIDLYDTPAYASLTDDELAENETFQAELAALNDQRNDAMITTFGLHGDLENPDPTTAEHWKWKY